MKKKKVKERSVWKIGEGDRFRATTEITGFRAGNWITKLLIKLGIVKIEEISCVKMIMQIPKLKIKNQRINFSSKEVKK